MAGKISMMMISLLSRAGKSPTSTGRMARTTPCRPRFAAGPQVGPLAPEAQQGSGAGGIVAVAVALAVDPAVLAVETVGHSNCGQ
jgi:hypothetical protein